MKNKIIMTILTTVFAAVSFLSCNTSDLVPEIPLVLEYSIINGDTIRIAVNENISKIKQKDLDNKYVIIGDTVLNYHSLKLHEVPEYLLKEDKIKNKEDESLHNKPLRYVAFGGSMSAGVQNGGYFNEGMATSYPSLIARQMKLAKFKQPEFANEDFNGFGRKIKTDYNPTGGPLPKFKYVSNNLGIESISEKSIGMSQLTTTEIDAISVPITNRTYIGANLVGISGIDEESQLFFSFLSRLFSEDKASIYDYYKEANFDLYTFDSGYDDILNVIFTGNPSLLGYSWNTDNTYKDNPDFLTDSPELRLIRYLHQTVKENKKSDIKGFLATIPNVLAFPVFNLSNQSDLSKNYGINRIYVRNPRDFSVRLLEFEERLIATSSIDSLLSPKVNIALKPGLSKENPLNVTDVIGSGIGINNYIEFVNTHFNNLGKKYGVNIVDLNSLFKQVIEGKYITHDGQRADASYPNGNFFNADGISLSPFGQAIVANEFLRVMNSVYDTKIPLISTAHYLQKK